MTALNVLNNEYFNWMYDLVCENEPRTKRQSYRKLLETLHGKEFTYSIEYDSNRAADGVDLRYRFAYLNHPANKDAVSDYLDDGPCSVLEMMIALAIRCEEHIMEDPEKGDRTSQWFWGMVDNLGLRTMSDEKFDARYTNRIVNRFLKREYDEDGKGGLFTVANCDRDMRTVDIWYQTCWYLDEVLGDVDDFDYI